MVHTPPKQSFDVCVSRWIKIYFKLSTTLLSFILNAFCFRHNKLKFPQSRPWIFFKILYTYSFCRWLMSSPSPSNALTSATRWRASSLCFLLRSFHELRFCNEFELAIYCRKNPVISTHALLLKKLPNHP